MKSILVKYSTISAITLLIFLSVFLLQINAKNLIDKKFLPLNSSEEVPVKSLAKTQPNPKNTPKPTFITTGFFTCQVGFFSNPDNAEYCMEICEDLNLPVFTQVVPIKDGNFATRILVGRFKTREDAERYKLVLVNEHRLGNVLVRIA
jgi:cell division septation protein DedD